MISNNLSSAPHVAGAAALMFAAQPTLKYQDVINKFQSTATRPSTTASAQCGSNSTNSIYPNNAYGNGRVNVRAALGL